MACRAECLSLVAIGGTSGYEFGRWATVLELVLVTTVALCTTTSSLLVGCCMINGHSNIFPL